MTSKNLLFIVIFMQVVFMIGLYFGPGTEQVQAQIPDPGAQRAQTIQLMQDQNAKLDKIIALLDGGNIQVRVAKPDEK